MHREAPDDDVAIQLYGRCETWDGWGGNCEGGHAKLADMEYAKEIGDLKSHDMRTASESPVVLSC